MTGYGGFGGVMGGRPLDTEDEFEMMIARIFDLSDEDLAAEVWSAFTNIIWYNDQGDEASYSFRAAGDMIAAIRAVPGEDYCRWYCSGPTDTVSERVAAAMLAEGWKWKPYEVGAPAVNLWDAETLAEVTKDFGIKPFFDEDVQPHGGSDGY